MRKSQDCLGSEGREGERDNTHPSDNWFPPRKGNMQSLLLDFGSGKSLKAEKTQCNPAAQLLYF